MALSGSKSYTLTIGNGPLAITIGAIHSASGLDASSYAEAPPNIKSFSIPRLARQPLSDSQPVSVLVSSL